MASRKLYTRFLQQLLPLLALAYLLAISVTTWLYYKDQLSEASKQRSQTLDTFAHVLAKPLWDCNSLTAGGIIQAMTLQPDVLGVSVLDQCAQKPIQAGVLPQPRSKDTLRTPLLYVDELGRAHDLGELRIAFRPISIFTAAAGGLMPQLAVFLSMLAAVLASALWTFRRTIGQPLSELRYAMREHQPVAPIPASWTEELTEVTETYNTQLQELRLQARHDPLTGLGNRLMLEEHLERTLRQAERTGNQGHVLVLDLDRFKPVNDRLGHAAGDEVLRVVAQRLLSCVRKTDVVTRPGGDEFVIVASNVSGNADADHDITALVQRIKQAMSRPVLWEGVPIEVSFSIGLAKFGQGGSTAASLLAEADAEMYREKTNTR